MSSKKHEFEIELIEYALDILGNRHERFGIYDVIELTGLEYNGQRISLICWVAEQCGYTVTKIGWRWEFRA